jgi:exportin-2 (importin alpha re-exporter)
MEIKNAISNAGPVMTQDAINLISMIFQNEVSKNEIILYLQILKDIMHIFFSFNSPDFPEFFEDNLENWMNIIKGVLEYYLKFDDNNILKQFIKLKTIAMRCLNLYCMNYYEDFINYHNDFISLVWNLLSMAKVDYIYSKLVKQFLDYYKLLFQNNRATGLNEEIVQLLINNLVLPNLQITHKELDDYEENPVNFLKIELEEVDMDSSINSLILDKYHAINLLKYILNVYNSMINNYIQPLINNLLNNYYSDPNKNWMNKIIAINLIFATMIKTFAQKSIFK